MFSNSISRINIEVESSFIKKFLIYFLQIPTVQASIFYSGTVVLNATIDCRIVPISYFKFF